MPLMIELKSSTEIDQMRRAAQIVARVLVALSDAVRPGVTTEELDCIAEDVMCAEKARPAFKGYRDFPATICTSVNEVVVHGIPSSRRVDEGDIIGVDVGVEVDGFYGDAAVTFPVGAIDADSQRLLDTTRAALEAGIAKAQPGGHLSDISHAVQSVAEPAGYGVVRQFVGHGIGRNLHEEPQVPNFGPPGRGMRLEPGLVVAIEPMLNMGTADVSILEDGWTAVTVDGQRSAHFEHTVAITEHGPEVLSSHAI